VATVSSYVMKYLKFSVLLKKIQPTSTNNILMEICDCFFYCLFISVLSFVNQLLLCGGHRGRDHMVVGFTTTCVLSAYHHLCFLNLNPAHDIQHYVINFVYVTNDHRYVPLVISTCRSFSRSWLITRVTRQVSLVERNYLPFLSTWVHSQFLERFFSFLCNVL
jgi:hypothetical protein